MGRPVKFRVKLPANPPAGRLVAASIGPTYVSIPKEARDCVDWLRSASVDCDVFFRLCEPGRAQAFLAADFVERVNGEFDSPAVSRAEDMRLTVHWGRFSPEDNLLVPLIVRAHVSGDVSGAAAFWIWATKSRIELWSEERRQHFTRLANERVATDIGLFSPNE